MFVSYPNYIGWLFQWEIEPVTLKSSNTSFVDPELGEECAVFIGHKK